MAREGRIQATIQARKGNYNIMLPPIQFQFDWATAKSCAGTQTIPTSDTVIGFGDLSTLGYAAFHNLDTSHSVKLGPQASGAIADGITLGPGQWAIFPLTAGSVWRAQAVGGSVELEKWILAL